MDTDALSSDYELLSYDIPNYLSRDQKIERLLSIARYFQSRMRTNGGNLAFSSLDEEDIYAIAATAIVQAVDDYDPKRSTKLSTYAMSRARWAIQDALRKYSYNTRTMVEQGRTITWLFSGAGDGPRQSVSSSEPHDIMEAVIRRDEREQLFRYVNRMAKQEKTALHIYLTESCNLKEVGERMALDKRRIYHLMNQAIKKMQHMHRNDCILQI